MASLPTHSQTTDAADMSIGNKTLGDFCRNPDGKTYDGRKLAQWLFEATTGKPMSGAEAQALIDEAQRRARARKADGNRTGRS